LRNFKLETKNNMGLMKVFSGSEILALALQEKIEEKGIETVLKNNSQSNKLIGDSNSKLALELFIQETDFAKANPVIEDFRMSI
jgi:Putative prokaryotic signal transducing protein